MNFADLRTTALGLLLAAASASAASAQTVVPFTWDPAAVKPGASGPFTADSISTTDFLLLDSADGSPFPPDGSTDTFIMQINGFSRAGLPVNVPGLNSSFGLYIMGTVGVSADNFYGVGSEKLVMDPTNNDGTPSATYDPVADKVHIGFSNAAGTADDITLATGNFLSGGFGPQSNGLTGVHFQYDFTPNPSEPGFVLSNTAGGVKLDQIFFNTPTSRMTGFDNEGNFYSLQNDGFGVDTFQVPEPATPTLLAAGMLSLIGLRRRR